MGFENRKSLRVPLFADIYFWVGQAPEGKGTWGHCSNVSATGLAFQSAQGVGEGERLLIELGLPEQSRHLQLAAQVVFCAPDQGVAGRWQIRVSFLNLESEDRHLIRLYVLQLAEPGMGWGRAYFPGMPAIDTKYRELAASDAQQWLQQRAYLSIKEVGYLKKFQASLEHFFGVTGAENFKLAGSRPLKEHSDAWIEFDLPDGQWHFLAKTLWCRQEKGEKAECGLGLAAFHKDEALKIEKGGA